ncbi:MAG TPA: DUF599 domain-containing protein [Dongiaceae bacterium]|jgi:uncharacterized membrane protein|nr:DUF599 domain-containing protein [Dongiaceae bacterium]
MIFDASLLDWVALAAFFVAVLAYSRYADHIGDRLLNARMREIRTRWLRRYLEREDRVIDSILTGHSINSITLFCSATLLIVVALLGVLTNADTAYRVAIVSTFVTHTTLELFQVKLIGLVCVFVYGFYRFTWALLQYNYFLALIGSAPFQDHLTPTAIDEMGNQMSVVLNSAVTSFHSGFRTYYYALAWVGWFFHPLVFIAATAFVTFILVYRQIASPSAGAIKGYSALLHEIEKNAKR